MKIAIDTSAISQTIISGLERFGSDWADLASSKAPRGKDLEPNDNTGTRSKPFGIRLGPPPDRSSTAYRERAEFLIRSNTPVQYKNRPYPSERAEHFLAKGALSYKRNHAIASMFRFTEGPNKGQAPEILRVSGGRLMGASRKRSQPGRLAASIESLGVTGEGGKYTVMVKASAPYAKYVEEGFHHKGGGDVKAQPFMRPAREELLLGLRRGDYFRGER